ncbi:MULTISPECIES: diguanylate cyclase [unclassified Neptuniibacter]|jgi:diguanylate cyclase (GGDEF)-like protein/PAS domain S-box-containing protein|uniref:diguanylate cyclase domain-containing protein n=1 Tax=Neptuniibacter TaxID=459520 RepID=UPI0026E359E2|nr:MULTISPECIES: diguanylate cyclase [unclassified Neptuniibacter]MDO6513376.1 diguanylate cyclase [Neptuniibacter sp. 2_MG-2023]MDO6593905.1 diguanylate cyclase [Neptuniibacter sp. 1_MG-2023]
MGNDIHNNMDEESTFYPKIDAPSPLVDNRTIPSQQLTILEALPYPAWIKNRRAEYLYANKAYADLVGIPVNAIKGRTDRQLFPKFIQDQLIDSDALVFHNKATIELDNIYLHSTATDTYWLSKSPLKNNCGHVTGIIGLMKLSPTLQVNGSTYSELATHAIKHSNEAIIIADTGFKITLVNPAFIRITGFSANEIIGAPASIINANWLAPEFMESIKHQLHYHGYWEGETWNRKKDGQLYNEKIKISVIRSSDGKISHYMGQFTDNTEQKQTQDKLEFLAFHDALTGLANRALFLDRVSQSIQQSNRNNTRCAVIYLDLNDFKPLNDTYGHPFGDKVLIHAANTIKEAVRKVDTVSRQGGDEFAVLLEEVGSVESVVVVAQKIITSLRHTFVIDNIKVNLGASAGISVYPEHGDDADKLISNSDKAMYAAKSLGGNGYYLYK